MYTILVADDEAIIREGIKVLFDYAALGFSICGEAADGDQALAQIQEMTLAFVPKILGVFFTLILLFPFMLNQMRMLSDTLFDKIVNGG